MPSVAVLAPWREQLSHGKGAPGVCGLCDKWLRSVSLWLILPLVATTIPGGYNSRDIGLAQDMSVIAKGNRRLGALRGLHASRVSGVSRATMPLASSWVTKLMSGPER